MVCFISTGNKLCPLPTLSVRIHCHLLNIKRAAATFPCKLICAQYTTENINICFTIKEERRTRGHGVTLAKKQCRLDIRNFLFSQRIVNEWNRLSADCVSASSVNIFKNKIDIYLRRAGYT